MLYASFICFNDTATTEIYTLSLHDALPISRFPSQNYIGWLFCSIGLLAGVLLFCGEYAYYSLLARPGRSEEHTLNSSHANISYAVFCLTKNNNLLTCSTFYLLHDSFYHNLS